MLRPDSKEFVVPKKEQFMNGGRKRACCKCGLRVAMCQKRSSYCLACHAASMRSWRSRHPYSDMDVVTRFKSTMRAYANVYTKRGKLISAPCCLCGQYRAEKHHPDYSQPLFVIWLCRSCHLDIHTNGPEENSEYVKRIALQWDDKRKLRVKQLRRVAKHQMNVAMISSIRRRANAKALRNSEANQT